MSEIRSCQICKVEHRFGRPCGFSDVMDQLSETKNRLSEAKTRIAELEQENAKLRYDINAVRLVEQALNLFISKRVVLAVPSVPLPVEAVREVVMSAILECCRIVRDEHCRIAELEALLRQANVEREDWKRWHDELEHGMPAEGQMEIAEVCE